MSRLQMVSKPTRRVTLGWRELARVVRGSECNTVKGLTRTGECLFVLTDRGLIEARECVERELGGMVLCRVV